MLYSISIWLFNGINIYLVSISNVNHNNGSYHENQLKKLIYHFDIHIWFYIVYLIL